MLARNGLFLVAMIGGLALAGCGGSATGTGGGGAGADGGAGGAAGGAGGSGGVSAGGSGGVSAGGSGGVGTGGTAVGGGGGSAAAPQCKDDAECQLVNDCCSCEGLAPGEPAPPCDVQECFVPTCDSLGKADDAAQCVAGQCVAGLVCDWNKAACDSLPPSCPPGQTATVNGACWGGCAAADECATVAGCEQCTGGLVCVTEETQAGPQRHCVAPPAACAGQPTCACMGAAVCTGVFNTCIDAPPGITCSCLDC